VQEKSEWTAEKQRLEKEVEQLHELLEYLFEHFNLPMDGDARSADSVLRDTHAAHACVDGADAAAPPAAGDMSFFHEAMLTSSDTLHVDTQHAADAVAPPVSAHPLSLDHASP
jgi:hypothetical protein